MSRRRLAVLALGTGLLGSQAGHLVAYQLRFGGAAQQLQSSGAHAYFPTLIKTDLGIAACVSVAALLVVGAARVASGRRIVAGSSPPFIPLLAALYTIQLAGFAGQETAEALVAGAPATPFLALLFWGAVGQLPVAAVGALALTWLLARLGPALAILRVRVAAARHFVFQTISPRQWPAAAGVALGFDFVSSDPWRGPPSF